mgnify:CR=1 FL=1
MNKSQENVLIEDSTDDYVPIKGESTEIIIDEPGSNEEYKIIRKN